MSVYGMVNTPRRPGLRARRGVQTFDGHVSPGYRHAIPGMSACENDESFKIHAARCGCQAHTSSSGYTYFCPRDTAVPPPNSNTKYVTRNLEPPVRRLVRAQACGQVTQPCRFGVGDRQVFICVSTMVFFDSPSAATLLRVQCEVYP